MLQSPRIQTRIANHISAQLSEGIDGEVTIGRVQILPFRTLIIRDLVLTDDNPLSTSFFEPRDTVARVGIATVSFSLKGLTGRKPLVLRKVVVRNGLLNLVTEDQHLSNFKRIFHQGEPEPMADKGEVLLIKQIEARNFHFRLNNALGKRTPKNYPGINWADVDVFADVRAHELHVANAQISGVADEIKVREKSGYGFHDTHGRTVVSNGKVEVYDFVLNDAASHLDIPSFVMDFEDIRSFGEFNDEVTLTARLKDTRLDARTVTGLTGKALPRLCLDIPGARFHGTLNDFEIASLQFRERGGIGGTLSATVSDITAPQDCRIDATVKDLRFTTASLGTILESVSPGSGVGVSRFAPGEHFKLDAKASGPLNDLAMTCDLATSTGSVSGDIFARDLLDAALPARIQGRLAAGNLDLGGILGTRELGECTLQTGLEATLAPGGIRLDIDSLNIQKAVIHGYTYSGIQGAGTYADEIFNGRLACNDPNLKFTFQGLAGLGFKTGSAPYKFDLNLDHADLQALNLDKRGPSTASLSLHADFERVGSDSFPGTLALKGVKLGNRYGVHDIGDVSLRSTTSDEKQQLTLRSTFADADYSGKTPVTRLVRALNAATLQQSLPALTGGTATPIETQEGRLTLKTYDSRALLAYLYPGLYVADGTKLDLRLGEDGALAASLSSQRLALKDKFIKNIALKAANAGDRLSCDLTGDELNAGVKLLGNVLHMDAENDRLTLSYGFDNPGEQRSAGTLALACEMSRDADRALSYDLHIRPSDIILGGEKWRVDTSDIHIGREQIHVPLFAIRNQDQGLEVSGGVSRNSLDTLSLDFHRLDLAPFNTLLASLPDVRGIVTGKARLISPMTKDQTNLDIHLTSRETAFSGYDAGTLSLSGDWDNEGKRMVFRVQDDLGGRTTLLASGDYKPATRDIQAIIQMDSLQIGYAGDFLKEIFSEMEGKASGRLTLGGRTDRISLASQDTRLDGARVRIAITNVPYFLSGPFHINEKGVFFDDISLRDRESGTGTVSGGIRYDHLRDFAMETSLKIRETEVLDKPDDGETPFYGKLKASGTVDITGPLSTLLLDIKAVTTGAGELHIPLRSSTTAGGKDLLTFKQRTSDDRADPYEEMLRSLSKKKNGKGSTALRMQVAARPEVQCELEISKESGNVLSGRGSGNILLEINPSTPLSIIGNYSLASGDFHFNAMNIASKKFTIESGSSVKFNGDLMESDLDVDAVYSTKASLANLIADSTATTSRRNVDCRIKISGKLRNPQLSFSIDIPDLDPATKSQVESALNSEDKIQKQFVALLVGNSFLPDDQSGIFNNNDLLMSNMMEVMSGQLSNILQRLQIPLDLGLKYATGEGGADLFDVAVSTKLFNDRVSVNGVIGNWQYSANGGSQDVVGDLDVEIKLDPAGTLRLYLFSHSADKYSNYLDYSQRNGVGLGYQREFNTIGSFLKSLFTSKKKKQELLSQPRPEEKKATLKIQQDE